MKFGESWSSRMNKTGETESNVTRHGSLGSIPRCYSVGAASTASAPSASSASSASSAHSAPDYVKNAKTLPKTEKSRQAFSVFRKRLKSDSRIIATSPKSETKESKDRAETKKKRFDFAQSRDLFRNFRASKAPKKNSKNVATNLSKSGETKSCEFLDETERVADERCSKSVECLDGVDALPDFDVVEDRVDIDIDASLSLPDDIVELILHGRDWQAEMRMKQIRLAEDDYVPMSPIVAPQQPIEHHYMVMSPKTNIA